MVKVFSVLILSEQNKHFQMLKVTSYEWKTIIYETIDYIYAQLQNAIINKTSLI